MAQNPRSYYSSESYSSNSGKTNSNAFQQPRNDVYDDIISQLKEYRSVLTKALPTRQRPARKPTLLQTIYENELEEEEEENVYANEPRNDVYDDIRSQFKRYGSVSTKYFPKRRRSGVEITLLENESENEEGEANEEGNVCVIEFEGKEGENINENELGEEEKESVSENELEENENESELEEEETENENENELGEQETENDNESELEEEETENENELGEQETENENENELGEEENVCKNDPRNEVYDDIIYQFKDKRSVSTKYLPKRKRYAPISKKYFPKKRRRTRFNPGLLNTVYENELEEEEEERQFNTSWQKYIDTFGNPSRSEEDEFQSCLSRIPSRSLARLIALPLPTSPARVIALPPPTTCTPRSLSKSPAGIIPLPPPTTTPPRSPRSPARVIPLPPPTTNSSSSPTRSPARVIALPPPTTTRSSSRSEEDEFDTANNVPIYEIGNDEAELDASRSEEDEFDTLWNQQYADTENNEPIDFSSEEDDFDTLWNQRYADEIGDDEAEFDALYNQAFLGTPPVSSSRSPTLLIPPTIMINDNEYKDDELNVRANKKVNKCPRYSVKSKVEEILSRNVKEPKFIPKKVYKRTTAPTDSTVHRLIGQFEQKQSCPIRKPARIREYNAQWDKYFGVGIPERRRQPEHIFNNPLYVVEEEESQFDKIYMRYYGANDPDQDVDSQFENIYRQCNGANDSEEESQFENTYMEYCGI